MNPQEKIEYEAALWVVRLERGLTPAEQDRFLEWLGSDPRHGEELSVQKAGWKRMNLLADWRPMHGARPNRDLLAPPAAGFRNRWWMTWRIPSALAAAAAVMMGIYLSQALKRPASSPGQSTPGQIVLIERRTLEDGSVVELNRGAELAVNYTAGERRIALLSGEAHFQVAKDAGRPFIVGAGDVTVRAVGTAFNVQRQTAAVKVLVTEGTVDVHAPAVLHPQGRPALVAAGQRCIVSLDRPLPPAIAAVTREEAAQLLAWQPRSLDFAEAPLRTIIAEFNRCNAPFQLVIPDAALADIPLSASLRSDNVEGFLRLLDGGFGIRAERAGNIITLRRTTLE